MTRSLRGLLVAMATLCALASNAHAQPAVAPISVTQGAGTPLCEYKVDGTNYAGCTVQYVWNGSAWVLVPVGAGAAAGAPRAVVAQDATTVAGSAPGGFTQPVSAASGAFAAGSLADGASATQGAQGDTACSTDNGACSTQALIKRLNQRITALITALGSPMQAGGSIGNGSFGISGSLPAFASTPAFTLSGTLPAFAATPAFKAVDSGNGDATDPVLHAVKTSPQVFGSDSGPIWVSKSVVGTHAIGSSVGGLFTVPVARTAGGSLIVTNMAWMSGSGSTGQVVFRVWAKNPTNTTCTDGTAFASSATDDQYLISVPFTLTPAAPTVTTGDAKTYATNANLTWDAKNADGTPTVNLYACAVTVVPDTVDVGNSVSLMLSGPEN